MFIHTLDMIPRNWYMSLELRRGIVDWDDLANSFIHTFSYANENPFINIDLQVIQDKKFEEIFVPVSSLPQWTVTIQNFMKCYNIQGEPVNDDP